MATRTTTQSGNASNSATFGGSALSNGDIVVVATGHTLTFDANYTLGSKSANVGDALTINATDAVTFGKVVVNDGVTLTLRGTDTTSNRLAFIHQYALFAPNPGATIVGDVASDYASIIDNRGRFECVGTSLKPITLQGANAVWSNQVTNEAKSATFANDYYDKPGNILSFILANPWISNAAGTGIGSFGDSSLSLTSPSPGTILQTEVASLDLVTGAGKFWVNYDAGQVYFYSVADNDTCNATYKHLTSLGWGIVSEQDTDYNTAIFDYCVFQYAGSLNNNNEAAILVRYKKSATVAANRLFQLTNSTIQFNGRFLGLRDCDGASNDKLLITGNTIRSNWQNGAYGDFLYAFRAPNSHVQISGNDYSGLSAFLSVSGTFSGVDNTPQDSWVISDNNISLCNTVLIADSFLNDPQAALFLDLDFSGNTISGVGTAQDTIGFLHVSGSASHPAVFRGNTLHHLKRVFVLGSNCTFDGNLIHDNYHHVFTGPNTDEAYVQNIQIINNILIAGGLDSTSQLQLGYINRMHFDGVTISNNTIVGSAIELGYIFVASGCSTITNAVIVDNLLISSADYGVRRLADTSTASCRAQLAALDHNLIFDPASGLYKNISHQAIFSRSSTRYNSDGTRNVTGVMLWDSTATVAPTNKSLVFTRTSATDQTLAWSGGTAVQLILDSGTATTGDGGSLTDSTKTWPTDRTDPACPQCCWLTITGGTGAGQKFIITNNTSDTLSVAPAFFAFTTPPDATSTYTITKSEVQLFDSGGTDYVRAGIDVRNLPTASKTDTGIDVSYNEPTSDPLTTQTGVFDSNPLHYKLGAGSPAINSAANIAGVTTDYFGVTRSVPDIGAMEFQAGGGGGSHIQNMIIKRRRM